jgi:hypothetical protein
LQRQCEEDDRREWEKLINTRISSAERRARDQVSQHRAKLHEEIEMKWAQKLADTKLRKKSDVAQHNMDTIGSTRHNRRSRVEQVMIPMEGITMDGATRPTIEEFSEELASSCGGGLDQSRHAPKPTTVEIPTPTKGPDAG